MLGVSEPRRSIRGRGSAHNPANRFLPLAVEREAWTLASDPDPRTEILEDRSRSIISYNNSPDLGFDASLNPYRGCETGCSYCYARPTHEYFGLSAGLDFESRILAKPEAPALLRRELASPRWKPQVLVLSGVTDPYQPVERRLGITRRCLEVLAEARNPVGIVTKHHRVTRNIDLLRELARYNAVRVQLSITTLDRSLQRKLEPRASTPERRLDAIARLADAGIPVGVNVAPVIPGLTDHEIPAILEAAAKAGAGRAIYIMLRLPFGVAALFEDWLRRNCPDRAGKVLNRMRELRGGSLYASTFGERMRGRGPFAEQVARLFSLARAKHGIEPRDYDLSAEHFRPPRAGPQLGLFDESGGEPR
ncbi:MAG: PA0069 family radical SAM protein [Gemmatimonadota bacterium]|uniref:PA0069 family radical SAM protein n=1 Tax=Candidatus Palauibacter scopulicola TaxID=3056741 RepID=UPI0023835031|nr:PA0069 family radical SAM protein [Candidatus Palauibacter scopulicola]MDE2662230.1 PA0069 family radical SAM protein [Candidatus Palauibacter scopulicola]